MNTRRIVQTQRRAEFEALCHRIESNDSTLAQIGSGGGDDDGVVVVPVPVVVREMEDGESSIGEHHPTITSTTRTRIPGGVFINTFEELEQLTLSLRDNTYLVELVIYTAHDLFVGIDVVAPPTTTSRVRGEVDVVEEMSPNMIILRDFIETLFTCVPSLRILNLSQRDGCYWPDLSYHFIGKALESNTSTITKLILNSPAHDILALKSLADGLCTNTHLRHLEIYGGGMGNEICMAMAYALTKNCTLETLRLLRSNTYTRENVGTCMLANSIKFANYTLQTIDFGGIQHSIFVSNEMQMYLSRLTAANRCLVQHFQRLPLLENMISRYEWERFVDLVPNKPELIYNILRNSDPNIWLTSFRNYYNRRKSKKEGISAEDSKQKRGQNQRADSDSSQKKPCRDGTPRAGLIRRILKKGNDRGGETEMEGSNGKRYVEKDIANRNVSTRSRWFRSMLSRSTRDKTDDDRYPTTDKK